jgi:hypothetical protein
MVEIFLDVSDYIAKFVFLVSAFLSDKIQV